MGELHEWDIAHSRLRSISAAEIKRFWNGYVAMRKPVRIEHGSLWSRWRPVGVDLVISLYLTNRSVGLFVRGPRGEGYRTTLPRLSAHEPELGAALGAARWELARPILAESLLLSVAVWGCWSPWVSRWSWCSRRWPTCCDSPRARRGRTTEVAERDGELELVPGQAAFPTRDQPSNGLSVAPL